jgi:hypothetical protein
MSRRCFQLDLRSLVGRVTLLAYLIATFGYPLWPVWHLKKGPTFPCQFRACGCLSAEECWAGDCCCFTLEEKIAWADARGVAVPAAARSKGAKAASSEEACTACCGCDKSPCCADHETSSCCIDHEASSRDPMPWVCVLSARKCRGEAAHATSLLPWQWLEPHPNWALLAEPAIWPGVQNIAALQRAETPPFPPPR